jgi:hypothetical protein
MKNRTLLRIAGCLVAATAPLACATMTPPAKTAGPTRSTEGVEMAVARQSCIQYKDADWRDEDLTELTLALEIHNPTPAAIVVHPDRVRLRTPDGVALPATTWGSWMPVEIAGNQTKTLELRFQNRASLRCAAPLQLQTAGSLTAQERPLATDAIAFTPVAARP